MNFRLGARPKIYLVVGPVVGLICMIIYTTILSNLISFGNFSVLLEFLSGILVFLIFAYIIGAAPAFLTGLMTDIVSKVLTNFFRSTMSRFIVAASIGFLVTLTLLTLFYYHTNEMDELFKLHPTSVLASSFYGAIAAVVCESLHIKMGSPDKLH